MYVLSETLKNILIKKIKQIDFFQAIRLLEVCSKNNLSRDQQPYIVFFKISDSYRFVWSIIESLTIVKGNISVYINISTLLTVKHATLLKKASRAEAEGGFIHYFMNRFIWIYYDAFKKSQLMPPHSDKVIQQDPLYYLFMHLVGVRFNETSSVSYAICYRYASALIHSRYSIGVLQHILANYFCTSLSIHLCLGKWMQISYLQQHYLTAQQHQSQPIHLNRTFLGQRIFLSCRQMVITIWPRGENYFTFLPSGVNFKYLVQFLKIYLPIKLNLIIKLKFYSNAVINCRLFSYDKEHSYYLGWTTCLHSFHWHSISPVSCHLVLLI